MVNERKLVEQLTREMMDQGRIIEAGFIALRLMSIAPDAPSVQVDEMRMAFFAGAQHLFGSIMSILEPGEEPTANDLKRLTLISEELERFIAQFKSRRQVH